MSAILSLLVLGAAVWFVTSLAGRAGFGNEPVDSVAQFSRAMGALSPENRLPSADLVDMPVDAAPVLADRRPQPRQPVGASAITSWFSASPTRHRQ